MPCDPPTIHLPPGRYLVHGIPPETGLVLEKWIEVGPRNGPGRYGPADIPIATAIAHIFRIEDVRGRVIWEREDSQG
ncbi:hypothetical protein L6R50_11465 [Myxococcota bacterium]|nr:hypothetical protein [Myxococcota bacterium]